MKTYFLLLDLKNHPEVIEAYEAHHKPIPEAIRQTILEAGVTRMDIYRFSNRLLMHMETIDDFSFEEKSKKDAANPVVQAWENLMATFQQLIPGTPEGSKWVLTNKIFEL